MTNSQSCHPRARKGFLKKNNDFSARGQRGWKSHVYDTTSERVISIDQNIAVSSEKSVFKNMRFRPKEVQYTP
jgi:hypothetical protein